VVKVSSSTESIQTPVEVVVPKKRVQEEPASPKTLLDKVVYVIGRETLSFDDICTRLQQRHWMPKRRSSVSNVLSAHKNLFLCPSRSMYNLRNKPRVSPIDLEPKSEELGTEAAEGANLDQALAAISDDDESDESEDDDESDEDESEDDDESDEDESEDEDEVAQAEPVGEFDTWLDKPMLSISPIHAHYHDEDNTVVLSEKSNGDGKWRAEIFISGVDLWCSGSSEDRQMARDQAESNLRAKIQTIGSIIADLGI
jgi:hypothetical protein